MASNTIIYISICVCVCSVSAESSQRPHISYIVPDQTLDIGDNLNLTCVTKYASNYSILWVKFDGLNTTKKRPFSGNEFIYQLDSRLSVVRDSYGDTNMYTLLIKDIQESDSGRYQCQMLVSTRNIVRANVELKVRPSPIFTQDSYQDGEKSSQRPHISYVIPDQTLDIGDNLNLTCVTKYASNYSVLWVKFDGPNTTKNSPLSGNEYLYELDSRMSVVRKSYDDTNVYTLLIEDIKASDAGHYQCQLLVSVKNIVRADVHLKVRWSPIFTQNSSLSIVTEEGKSVQMLCFADGFPEPEVSWHRSNKTLLPSGGCVFRGNILEIPAVRREHAGNYFCIAQNGVGERVRRKIHLEVVPLE